MITIQSYSDFSINELITYQGKKYFVRDKKELTRGLKAYRIERL